MLQNDSSSGEIRKTSGNSVHVCTFLRSKIGHWAYTSPSITHLMIMELNPINSYAVDVSYLFT